MTTLTDPVPIEIPSRGEPAAPLDPPRDASPSRP